MRNPAVQLKLNFGGIPVSFWNWVEMCNLTQRVFADLYTRPCALDSTGNSSS